MTVILKSYFLILLLFRISISILCLQVYELSDDDDDDDKSDKRDSMFETSVFEKFLKIKLKVF